MHSGGRFSAPTVKRQVIIYLLLRAFCFDKTFFVLTFVPECFLDYK